MIIVAARSDEDPISALLRDRGRTCSRVVEAILVVRVEPANGHLEPIADARDGTRTTIIASGILLET